MHRRGDLEASGGAPYLASLADGMPKVSNIEHYARIVKEKALLRNLIHATHNIQQRAFEGEDGADAILDNAESSIFALAEDRVKAGLISIKDIVRDNFERLEKIFREGKSITGVPTGYVELDKLTSGLQSSELLILAARPSQGKTALALNLAENIGIRAGQPVAIFSLEMSKESLLQRLVASVAQIDAHKFRTGHLSREDWRRMTEALGTISSAPLWIDDAGSISVLEIGAKGAPPQARQRLVALDRRLLAADHRARPLQQPQRRSLQHFAQLEGPRQRAENPRAGSQPAHARSGARRTRPAAFRPARIGRHRTGRRRGHVHLPPALSSNTTPSPTSANKPNSSSPSNATAPPTKSASSSAAASRASRKPPPTPSPNSPPTMCNWCHGAAVGAHFVCAVLERAPSPPPPFFVSAESKGLNIFRKSFRMNTCRSFLEVFILKGLRGQKSR